MDIVANSEPLVVCGRSAASSDIALEPVLRILNLVWGILVVVVGIDIEIRNVIAEISHVLFTARSCGAA